MFFCIILYIKGRLVDTADSCTFQMKSDRGLCHHASKPAFEWTPIHANNSLGNIGIYVFFYVRMYW